jgi:hypothetical protein
MMRSSGRSWRIHSSGGRAIGRRRPVSGSLRKRVLFHTHTPAYFSFWRITWIVESAHPCRAGPRFVSLAGKGTPSAFSAYAIVRMLRPAA